MDVDAPPGRESTLVNILECALPGETTVTILLDENVQSQWSVTSFLRNIFCTQDTDSLRQHFMQKTDEIKDIHEKIWPGYTVPPMYMSRHDQAESSDIRGENLGPTFLKTKTIPTSLAVSWLVWSVSKSKRREIDRVKSQKFLRNLLEHVLEAAGTLRFSVVAIGRPNARAQDVQISHRNDFFDHEKLWDNRVRGRIVRVWEEARLRQDSQITSNWDRPQWIDFVVFALDPKSGSAPQLLAPLAWSILAQTAEWMDNNMERLAVSSQSIRNSRQKNREETMRVTKSVLTSLAQFLLYENEPLLHYGASCVFF